MWMGWNTKGHGQLIEENKAREDNLSPRLLVTLRQRFRNNNTVFKNARNKKERKGNANAVTVHVRIYKCKCVYIEALIFNYTRDVRVLFANTER